MKIASRVESRLSDATRYFMAHSLSGYLPLFIVNEYPKSGGTWLGQMIADALKLPFPRNRMPSFTSSVSHGHYLSGWGMKNVTVIWRDGRDVMVSWYHHSLFAHEFSNQGLVEKVRKDLQFADYSNVVENMPKFIEYSFTKQKTPNFSWSEFVVHWYDRPDTVYTTYEKLKQNAASEIVKLVFALTGVRLPESEASAVVSRYSFDKQSGRKAGIENKGSFWRKGISGDWENNFNHEARVVFDHFAGKELVLLGYEKDNAWVEQKRK